MADRKEGIVKWFNEKEGMVLYPMKEGMIYLHIIAI